MIARDAWGRPVLEDALRGMQTARLAQLHREFEEHPGRGLDVPTLAAILREAEGGDLVRQCQLFEDMEERDGHVFAEMSKRKRALLGLDWHLEPPRGATAAERAAAEEVHELVLGVPDLEAVLFDLLDAVGKGFACLEIDWRAAAGLWLPRSITHRPPSWFMTRPGHRDELRLRDGSAEGAALWPFGWIRHVHKAKSGYVARGGLHRVLAWPYLFKNYALRDLAEFLELYGVPMRLGTYPSGASDEEKRTLMTAVMGIGHNAAGIVPEGMAIEFREAARGGSMPFTAMIDWCERTQSKAILGGTLTSQADGASSTNALGRVHNDVRRELTVSDARQVASTLTRDLVYPIAALNGLLPAGARRAPRFRFETRATEDLATFARALPPLVDAGVRMPRRWVHEKLGIPEPRDGEAVLQRTFEPPPGAAAPGRANPASPKRPL